MKIFITGASSGIGEALARVGASRHYDLVITARRKDRLNKLADELASKYKIDVDVIVADLTDTIQRQKVIDYIRTHDIDVVINNAGFGSSGPFSELDISNELNEINLNINALVEITHSALSTMIPKRRGTIVNISSIASYQPMTGNAVYGATKAFVTSFTHALREELSESGVNVMMVNPGMTHSEFHNRSQWKDKSKSDPLPEFIWQTSQEVAQAAFNGIDRHQGVVIPGVTNKLLAAISSSLPGTLTRKITAIVAKGHRIR